MNSPVVEFIKKTALKAMVSDDYLFDKLVLKGGNAMDLIYRISGRASMDLDFSIQNEFPKEDIDEIENKVITTIEKTFAEFKYKAFDINFFRRPKHREVSDELKNFWGGYRIEFKVISIDKYNELEGVLTAIQRNAIPLNERQDKKYQIDISKFEYTKNKREAELDGYTLFVYTPEMLAIEKLRAICQQMPEYGEIVRSTSQSARARDFFDIELLARTYKIDFKSDNIHELVSAIFDAKNVPLEFIGRIKDYEEFHKQDFYAIKDTVPSSVILKDYEFYFNFVCDIAEDLKTLWVE